MIAQFTACSEGLLMKLKRKAFGLFIRRAEDGVYELLTLTFPDADGLRFPGGNLDEDETPEEGLFREIEEELGWQHPRILRKLGEHCYFKPFIMANVERHDFLMTAPIETPPSWHYQVTGKGGDAGDVFTYRWIRAGEVEKISQEIRTFVTAEHIPELFETPNHPDIKK
jgi:8-oxo-dGTP pyrophosphatase MutT (NUDIX family)